MIKKNKWVRVVLSAEVGSDGLCPVCGAAFDECPCPGPTQPDEYQYQTIHGVLHAKPHLRISDPELIVKKTLRQLKAPYWFDSESLAQEIRLFIHRNPDLIDGILLRRCYCRAVDYIREQDVLSRRQRKAYKASGVHLHTEVDDDIPSDEPSPLELLDTKDNCEHVRAAIEKLPTRQKRVIKGIYFAGLGVNELSKRLLCSESRISQLKNEGLASLKEILSK